MKDWQLLDDAICEFLKTHNGHPTDSNALIELAGGKWRRIDARMQAMRRAGRIKFRRGSKHLPLPPVPGHGWMVIEAQRAERGE
jgi:hypothetical protein